MIEKMTKYSFILLKDQTEGLLKRLQELGIMDITRSAKAVDQESASLMASLEEQKSRIKFLKSGKYDGDQQYRNTNPPTAQ